MKYNSRMIDIINILDKINIIDKVITYIVIELFIQKVEILIFFLVLAIYTMGSYPHTSKYKRNARQ